jgi:hypothetical protein
MWSYLSVLCHWAAWAMSCWMDPTCSHFHFHSTCRVGVCYQFCTVDVHEHFSEKSAGIAAFTCCLKSLAVKSLIIQACTWDFPFSEVWHAPSSSWRNIGCLPLIRSRQLSIVTLSSLSNKLLNGFHLHSFSISLSLRSGCLLPVLYSWCRWTSFWKINRHCSIYLLLEIASSKIFYNSGMHLRLKVEIIRCTHCDGYI